MSTRVREFISDGENELFLSAASGWGIAIKAGLGKLSLQEDLDTFVFEQLSINGIYSFPVKMRHALRVYNLPDYHRDPFDRLIIAQAQVENMAVITADPQFARYSVEIIW